MTAKKKRGGNRRKKPVGRPKKYTEGGWWDYHETIALAKDTKELLKGMRAKKREHSYNDTIVTLIEIMRKIGKDYLDMDNPMPAEVLDGIFALERKMKEEGDEV